jgi:hypothetical protein
MYFRGRSRSWNGDGRLSSAPLSCDVKSRGSRPIKTYLNRLVDCSRAAEVTRRPKATGNSRGANLITAAVESTWEIPDTCFHAGFICSAYSSTLKMRAICSSETSVDFQRTTRLCIITSTVRIARTSYPTQDNLSLSLKKADCGRLNRRDVESAVTPQVQWKTQEGFQGCLGNVGFPGHTRFLSECTKWREEGSRYFVRVRG